ncbi:MAG: 4Fe-4S binding protein [Candidatus Berkelbacteria bacterium]|nr:4Fe-4S binding protein [Candidatus Berkelbacteria bacterium]
MLGGGTRNEESGKFKINSTKCKGCGTCAENCPVGAISKEEK